MSLKHERGGRVKPKGKGFIPLLKKSSSWAVSCFYETEGGRLSLIPISHSGANNIGINAHLRTFGQKKKKEKKNKQWPGRKVMSGEQQPKLRSIVFLTSLHVLFLHLSTLSAPLSLDACGSDSL